MRAIIIFLLVLMFLIAGNVAAYVISEDYRFFLKKIKYQNEVVYENQEIDDSQRLIIIDNPDTEDPENTQIIVESEGVTFLEALSGGIEAQQEEQQLPQTTREELEVLNALSEVFVLREDNDSGLLFGLTDEYPDEYRHYSNAHMSFYMFSSKRYSAVKNIFEVLEFDLPIELNEVNNIADASFFINMQDGLDDGNVRIVFEYQKYAFGLKIKKDNYNRSKNALEQL